MAIDEPPRFGGHASEPIDRRLREAAGAYADTTRAETLLREAQQLDPQCLPVYFALYKFYFYKKRLADAESAALMGLTAAAYQAGFAVDWTVLSPQSAQWTATDGPQHFYLFSLKALAFIRLRLGRTREAAAILAKLAELDPQDSVGASVVRALASATA
jgi:hypothetical protein